MVRESEVVETLRPDGKKGITLQRLVYEELSSFILTTLDTEEEVTLNKLLDEGQLSLKAPGVRDMAYLILQVKLDLEARGFIYTYNTPVKKQLMLLGLTRHGQKRIRLERQLNEWRVL